MEPTLSVDDLIIVRETENIMSGDIVMYQSEGAMVVHRIIDIDGDIITTQGDANNTSDTPFDKSCIKGKMIAHSHTAGKLLILMRKYYVLLVALFAAYLLSGVFGAGKEGRGEDS
jgi:signal peptidase I